MGSNIEVSFRAIIVPKEEKELQIRVYVSKVDFVPYSMVDIKDGKDADIVRMVEPVQPIVVYPDEVALDDDVAVKANLRTSVEAKGTGVRIVLDKDDIHPEANVDSISVDYSTTGDIKTDVVNLKTVNREGIEKAKVV